MEYGSSLAATRAFGMLRSLYDTVYNMNMAHLSRARKTVFEHLDDAGLRTACTTYLIYRGRTRHEPSGRLRLPRLARRPSSATPCGGRASSSTPTSSTPATPAAARRSACRASATSTPAASARTWSRTTCSTSCSSRCPTTTRYSHRYGPDAQIDVDRRGRPRARAHHARRRRRRRVPRRPRRDRDVRPLADRRRASASTSPRRSADWRCWSRRTRPRATPSSRSAPSARSARSTCSTTTRRERSCDGPRATCATVEGVDLVAHLRGRRGRRDSAARRAALRARRRLRGRRAASAGASRASESVLDLELSDGRVCESALPGRARPPVVGPQLPDARATCWSRRRRATSSSTGAGRTTSAAAATARCTAATRSGVLLMCGVDLPDARRAGRITDVTPLVLEHFGATLRDACRALTLRRTCACAPACASPTTGSS